MLLKADITELRKIKTVLEDKVTQLHEDLTTYKTKSDSLTTLCRQMELTRDEALEGQAKLRSEMKVMQQSVTASKHQLAANNNTVGTFGGGGLAAAGGGSDVESAVKLCEAKYEAKLRQQSNKLDFLKSQLSAGSYPFLYTPTLSYSILSTDFINKSFHYILSAYPITISINNSINTPCQHRTSYC